MGNARPYRLGLYEKAMPADLSWAEKFRNAKEAGFDWLEISIDETPAKQARLDMPDPELHEIKEAMAQSGLPMLTMCLSGHRKFPLGSHDPQVSEQSLVIMAKAIDLALKLGIRIIQLAGYDVYYETSDESTRAWFRENLAKSVDLAARSGVILAFETMETLFMDTCRKSMVYIAQLDNPYLKLYPDVGNLTNASRISGISVQDDIASAHGHIVAAHLKEIVEGAYREIPFGTGDTRYDEALELLVKQGVRLFTGEFWYTGNPAWKADLAFANTYLRAKIERFLP